MLKLIPWILLPIALACKPFGSQSKSSENGPSGQGNDSPLIMAQNSVDQSVEKGMYGYDLAKEDYDFSRFRKSWFDITCQFRLRDKSAWVNVVNQNGYPVDIASSRKYCDNRQFQTDKEVSEQYLLLGYTPRVSQARDGSNLKKNFALLMRAYARQNIGEGLDSKTDSAFQIDGYLMDYRLSTLMENLSEGRQLFHFDKFCKYLTKAGDIFSRSRNIKTILDDYQKESGDLPPGARSMFWEEVAKLDEEGFRSQILPLCSYNGGPAFSVNANFGNEGVRVLRETQMGSIQVASFGRTLYSGALQVTPGHIKNRSRNCRYEKLSPQLTIGTEVLPIFGVAAGVSLGVEGKVCFDSYVHVESPKTLTANEECLQSGKINCVPDFSVSLISTPSADISVTGNTYLGAGIAPVVEAGTALNGSLQLAKFDSKSASTAGYMGMQNKNQIFISSIDYQHQLESLGGSLSIELMAGLEPRLRMLYDAMVGIVKNFDSLAKVAQAFADFKTNYLTKNYKIPLVQFPKKYSWDAYSHSNPLVMYKSGSAKQSFIDKKDGCLCYQVLADLVQSRRVLIHSLECLADHSTDPEELKNLAADKTSQNLLFADMEAYCSKILEDSNCPSISVYQQTKNAVFAESNDRLLCDPSKLPDLFGSSKLTH